MRRVIVTGDDFGLALPVNEAIELAHRDGILKTTSLLVSGPAVEDAVERARRLPDLRVGLHVALVDERPVLPREQIPDLLDADGLLYGDLVRSGFRFFFRPGIRQQIEAEVRAQFEAFARTGLPLDHVNSHNHMHLHPTLLRILLRVGREFGMNAIRLPYEPPLRSWRAAGTRLGARLRSSIGLRPWTLLLRQQVRNAGLRTNDYVFGMTDSGAMEEELLLRVLRQVPPCGVTELYFHPATRRCPEIDRTMPRYRHEQELAALCSARVQAAFGELELEPISYSDLS